MESEGMVQSWAPSVEDLLAFVDRASVSVRAALERPSKPSRRINLKRYIQKRIHRRHEFVRNRATAAEGKGNAMSKSRMSAQLGWHSTDCATDAFNLGWHPTGSTADTSISEPSAPAYEDLRCDHVGGDVPLWCYDWSSSVSESCGDHQRIWTSRQDGLQEPMPGDGSHCNDLKNDVLRYSLLSGEPSLEDSKGHVGSTDGALLNSHYGQEEVDYNFVDPVFPSENCDQIVPFIAETYIVDHEGEDTVFNAVREEPEHCDVPLASCMFEIDAGQATSELGTLETSAYQPLQASFYAAFSPTSFHPSFSVK